MDSLFGINILHLIYLIASVSFILGLKMLSNPKNARKGNLIAAGGMALAILGTIFLYENEDGRGIGNFGWIFAGTLIGSVIGVAMAKKVKMTAMPQMVSFFNGMGGACAAVISLVEFHHLTGAAEPNYLSGAVLVMLLGLIIGSVSFSGSMIAYGKLEGKIGDKVLPGQQFINLFFVSAMVAAGALIMIYGTGFAWLFYVILVLALIYGVLFVMPIGGADMPVVISLLNSFTGIAAALGGFLYDNNVMLTGGILVGSAGTILTIMMCKAMNRSLKNVLLGAFGSSSAAAKGATTDQSINEANIMDVAILCSYAKRVAIVPGYGLAVAQAQHTVHNLEKILEEKGVEVVYAIHPVAGRMPGHMNVLLAEADVPYDRLMEMEEINPELASTDVVLVIGANDVVNPAARNDPSSPIYGMPILDVDKSKNVIILKRSMRAGYAGIENELFYYPRTRMLFGDAKDSLEKLIKEIKDI